jgi:hypothetical protein
VYPPAPPADAGDDAGLLLLLTPEEGASPDEAEEECLPCRQKRALSFPWGFGCGLLTAASPGPDPVNDETCETDASLSVVALGLPTLLCRVWGVGDRKAGQRRQWEINQWIRQSRGPKIRLPPTDEIRLMDDATPIHGARQDGQARTLFHGRSARRATSGRPQAFLLRARYCSPLAWLRLLLRSFSITRARAFPPPFGQSNDDRQARCPHGAAGGKARSHGVEALYCWIGHAAIRRMPSVGRGW